MTAIAERLDLRLSAEDKRRIRNAAALAQTPLAAFVRNAALREADAVLNSPAPQPILSLSARLRGRATTRMSTEQIMQLTRDA